MTPSITCSISDIVSALSKVIPGSTVMPVKPCYDNSEGLIIESSELQGFISVRSCYGKENMYNVHFFLFNGWAGSPDTCKPLHGNCFTDRATPEEKAQVVGSINVGKTKTVDQIVKAVLSRLLPSAKEQYKAAIRCYNVEQDYKAKVAANILRVETILNEKYVNDRGQVHATINGQNLTVENGYSGSCYVKLSSVSFDLLEKIVELLKTNNQN